MYGGRVGPAIALSCLIAVPHPALADASQAGRGGGHSTGAGGQRSGQGTPGGVNGRTPGRAPRPSAPPLPTTPRSGRAAPRNPARWPVVAVAVAPAPDQSERDVTEPGAPPVRPTPTAPSEPSSVQPLRPSPLPETSQSVPRGTLRLEIGPASAQLYVDGFYVGTVGEANQSEAGLSLPAGWHRLEIRAPGYVTPAINVTIEANRMVSYRGQLTPLPR